MKRIILINLTLFVSFGMLLLAYVVSENQSLHSYATSLAQLPEVTSVESISTFSGTEQYYVAKVNLTNDTQQYYFVLDNEVRHTESVESIKSIDEILTAAKSVAIGEVAHYYLGMIEENRAIYEVKIVSDESVVYVIVDALTAEIVQVMNR